MKEANGKKTPGGVLWAATLVLLAAFLLIPATNALFVRATNAAPYPMGFIKFAILATMGEILANRITLKRWQMPKGAFWKAVVWGVAGMLIVLMFQLFPAGVQAAADRGYLWLGSGFLKSLLAAFFTSAVMNLTFGAVFMAAHRVADLYIEARCEGKKQRVGALLDQVAWGDFIRFVLGKTIPLFWIPMHTLSFLLPADYRVLFAAFLSIALGGILAYAKNRRA